MHIDKIALRTTDLEAAKRFYHDLFGFAVAEATPAHISFSIGRSVLSFVKSETPAFYHIAFLIPSNTVSAALQWIGSKTTVLPFTAQSPIANFANWNAEAFYFHDHQLNILEAIAHHDLENNTENAFTTSSFLAICEVGIVVRSVPETCAFLNKQVGIPHFAKGPRLAEFAVMGDEDGLLIVTTAGRGWLPALRPAESHAFNLQGTQNGLPVMLNESMLPT